MQQQRRLLWTMALVVVASVIPTADSPPHASGTNLRRIDGSGVAHRELPTQTGQNDTQRGMALWHERRYEDAALAFGRAIQLAPGDRVALGGRARCRLALHDNAGALADFTAAIAFGANDSDTYSSRAAARRGLGDTAGALADVVTALQKNPRNARAVLVRGQIFTVDGKTQAAWLDIEQAIRLDPEYPDAYVARALIRELRRDTTGALADYGNAVARDPRHVDAFMNRGRLRTRLGDLAGAQTDLAIAVELDPRRGLLYLYRSQLRLKTGDGAAARADAQTAAVLSPNDSAIQAHLAAIRTSPTTPDSDPRTTATPSTARPSPPSPPPPRPSPPPPPPPRPAPPTGASSGGTAATASPASGPSQSGALRVGSAQFITPDALPATLSFPGGAAITVPAGALSKAGTIRLQALTAKSGVPFQDLDAKVLGVYEWSVEPTSSLRAPLTLVLPFDPATLNPLVSAEHQLGCARWSASESRWRGLDSRIATSGAALACSTDQPGVVRIVSAGWDGTPRTTPGATRPTSTLTPGPATASGPFATTIEEDDPRVDDRAIASEAPHAGSTGAGTHAFAHLVDMGRARGDQVADIARAVGRRLGSLLFVSTEFVARPIDYIHWNLARYKNFRVVCSYSAIRTDPKVGDATWPPDPTSLSGGVPSFVADVNADAEQALQAYVAAGFTNMPPRPIEIKVNSWLIRTLGDPGLYDYVNDRIHINTRASIPLNQNRLKHRVAHELFHGFQHVIIPTGGPYLWWTEASAEYASCRIPWKLDLLMGHGTQFAKLLEFPLSATGLPAGATDEIEYDKGYFIQYLAEQRGFVLADAHRSLATYTGGGDVVHAPLSAYLSTKTGMDLGEHYRRFAGYYLLSASVPGIYQTHGGIRSGTGPDAVQSSITPLGTGPVRQGTAAPSAATLALTPGYTAKIWALLTDVGQEGVVTISIRATDISGAAVVDVYTANGGRRVIGQPTPVGTLRKKDDVINLSTSAQDVVYAVAVNPSLAQGASVTLTTDVAPPPAAGTSALSTLVVTDIRDMYDSAAKPKELIVRFRSSWRNPPDVLVPGSRFEIPVRVEELERRLPEGLLIIGERRWDAGVMVTAGKAYLEEFLKTDSPSRLQGSTYYSPDPSPQLFLSKDVKGGYILERGRDGTVVGDRWVPSTEAVFNEPVPDKIPTAGTGVMPAENVKDELMLIIIYATGNSGLVYADSNHLYQYVREPDGRRVWKIVRRWMTGNPRWERPEGGEVVTMEIEAKR